MKYILLAVLMGGFFVPAYAANNQPSGTPVTGGVINRSTVNGSVTITAGNTFQTVLTSNLGTNTQRQSLTIQNNNTNTDGCWITFGKGITQATATKAASIVLAVGQAYTRYWPYVPSDEIEATCTGTSDTLYIDSQ